MSVCDAMPVKSIPSVQTILMISLPFCLAARSVQGLRQTAWVTLPDRGYGAQRMLPGRIYGKGINWPDVVVDNFSVFGHIYGSTGGCSSGGTL